MNLSQLKQQAIKELNKQPEHVMLRLFERFRQEHMSHPSEFDCGCDYCVAVSRYVAAKLRAHRLKKRFERSDSGWGDYFTAKLEYERLRNIKNAIKFEL